MSNDIEKSQIKLGLDFGTAYSFMAYKDPEVSAPEILLSMVNKMNLVNGIPSLFWSDRNGNIRVGADVKNGDGEWNDAKGVVSSIKMKLNEDEIRLHNKTYKPQEIVKQIINHIFKLAEEGMEEDDIDIPTEKKIVMGVPVQFGDYERNLLSDAVESLGYDVELLPEPMAAATYYACKRADKFEKVLVFDMGAGTFDAAFLEKNDFPSYKEPYPYRCPKNGFKGNRKAGDVVDKALVKYMISKISPRPSEELIKQIQNENNIEYRQLLIAARKIKEKLSANMSYTYNFSLGNQSGGFSVTISRDQLEKVAAPVINEAVDICYNIVQNCNMENEDFFIIMVGGMSNLPMIKDALSRKFPKQTEKIQIKSPSHAVAFGCALYAEQPRLARRVSYGYAVESYYNNKQVLSVEIPADVKLPYAVESHYATRYPNQQAVEFRIYEVPEAKEGDYLKFTPEKYTDVQIQVVHNFNRPVPAGTVVTFRIELTESGILHISVKDDGITDNVTTRERNLGLAVLRKGNEG